jgi:hypothetical protein
MDCFPQVETSPTQALNFHLINFAQLYQRVNNSLEITVQGDYILEQIKEFYITRNYVTTNVNVFTLQLMKLYFGINDKTAISLNFFQKLTLKKKLIKKTQEKLRSAKNCTSIVKSK